MTDLKQISAPFTIVSASIRGGWLNTLDEQGNRIDRLGIDVVNYHEDKPYVMDGSPLQSPFTQQWVGGHQHRHVDLNNDGLDNARNRAEGWHVKVETSGIKVFSHRIYTSPPAIWTRDGATKRPLNIANIPTTTASVSYGNYRLNYEVVHTGGKFGNSSILKKLGNSGSLGSLRTRFVLATNAELDNTRPSRQTLDSIKNKSVIISRFNAPGGVNESTRASLDVVSEELSANIPLTYRNHSARKQLQNNLKESAQQFNANLTTHGVHRNAVRTNCVFYLNDSPEKDALYNRVSADNFYVQRPIPGTDIQYNWISGSSLINASQLGGYQSASIAGGPFTDIRFSGELDNRVLNSNKKEFNIDLVTNTIKPITKIDLSAYTVDSFPTGNVNGQGFILTNRAAIRMSSGTPWIILQGGPAVAQGLATIDFRFTTPISFILTSQEVGSLIATEDLALEISTDDGNTWTVDQILRSGTSRNTLTKSYIVRETRPYYLRFRFTGISSGFAWIIKDLITYYPYELARANDAYSFAPWKQTRIGEHPVAKSLRENNYISLAESPRERSRQIGGHAIVAARRESINNFKEPAISLKYKPLRHKFIFKGNSNPFLAHEVVHTFNNNLSMFANKELNNKVGVEEIRDQVYDRLREFYSDSDTSEEDNPIAKFLGYSIEETIYPKEENTSLGNTRGRQSYIVNRAGLDRDGYDRQFGTQRSFWRDNIIERARSSTGSVNSQGYFISNYNVGNTFYDNFIHSSVIYPDANYTYDSTISSTYASIGQNSVLPIEYLSNNVLLLTSSISYSEAGGSPIDVKYVSRMHTFDIAGELNSTVWIDQYFGLNGQMFRTTDLGYFLLQPGPNTPARNAGGGNTLPFLFHTAFSSSAVPKPKIRFCAFLGGLESGSKNLRQDDNELWSQRPRTDRRISSSLDSGLRYVADRMSGKKPWFDSYEKYVDDIRGIAKSYSILPEFRISEHIKYYVSQSGGNFRAPNNAFLTIDGVGSDYRSALTETDFYNQNFFKTYVNSDQVKNYNLLHRQNKALTKLDKITFKVSGIKKLLPYNGFYPINRTVQLANLYGEYVKQKMHGGFTQTLQTEAFDGKNIIVNTAVANAAYQQTALEPMFAPGILYNTIKSGIAVDWPGLTASNDSLYYDFSVYGSTNAGYVGEYRRSLGYRLPFETLLNPEVGFPKKQLITSSFSSSAELGDARGDYLNILRGAYLMGHFEPTFQEGFAVESPGAKKYLGSVPFTYIVNNRYSTPEFNMAMHNFLGETVRFFLQDQKLNAFVSKEESRWKTFDVSKTYYFDITLNKSPSLVMCEAHSQSYGVSGFPTLSSSYISSTRNGRYFGYPVAMMPNDLNNELLHNDPAYAPYTPPYFEGEATVRCSFKPTATRKYTLDEIFSGLQLQNLYPDLEDQIEKNSQAFKHKMSVTASVDIFGATRLNEIEFDANKLDFIKNKFKPSNIKQSTDSGKNVWVISPKMETPVLDFSDQPFEKHVGDWWSDAGFGRGMWSGYGKIPSGSKAITLEIKESFPFQSNLATSRSGSLLRQVGFRTETKKIGQIADAKEISEAVVAIPFVDYVIPGVTLEINGLNFIRINKSIFNTQRRNVENKEAAIKLGNFGSKVEIQETSISKMIEAMPDYVIPPQYNFLQYTDIQPFVMYIFEFKHTLDQQDLSDIWQGLMPKIATTAQLDEIEFSHPSGGFEFFHNKELPQNIRWMVFKVKKKAESNYFNVTPDSTDDERFKFDFQIGRRAPEYSYNWPYDFCSLVEFAKIELTLDYENKNLEDKVTKNNSNSTISRLKNLKKKRGNKKK